MISANKSTFTPGPWKSNCFLVTDTSGVGMYGGREICHTGGGRGTSDESEANARLIAAAPELLAACEAALLKLSSPLDKISVAADMLRTAIAKAKL